MSAREGPSSSAIGAIVGTSRAMPPKRKSHRRRRSRGACANGERRPGRPARRVEAERRERAGVR